MGNLNSFVGPLAAALVVAGCATQPAAPPEPILPIEPAPVEPAPVELPPPEPAPAKPAPVPMATVRPDAPLRYVVKKGDTLWDIAGIYLRDPWQWPELWYANPQVRNPHLIYPGDVLQLVYRDGRPILGREGELPLEFAEPGVPENIEKLQPRIREIPLQEAIPTIPIDAIRHFLRGPRVVGRRELERAPYVLEFADEHMMGSAGNGIYVKNLSGGDGFSYTVVRRGTTYVDPETDEILGYEAIPVAQADLREPGQPALMQLTESFREALIGDRLLPSEAERFDPHFVPHAPGWPVSGQIIAVFDGLSQIGQFQIVTVNRGVRHGLEPGHVLSILQRGRKVRDPYGTVFDPTDNLPELYAGTLMIFKVNERLSYGLVMSAVRAIHVNDRVDTPKGAVDRYRFSPAMPVRRAEPDVTPADQANDDNR